MGIFSVNKRDERIGEIRTMKDGTPCKCIEYRTNNDGDYQMLDEHGYICRNRTYINFVNGCFQNPYTPKFYGRGYIGEGFNHIDKPKAYRIWTNMLERVYGYRFDSKNIAYKDCSVDEEWFNFQNFVKWHDENLMLYTNEEPYNIDKDLLIKNNKLYSKNTCMLVPRTINSFIQRDKSQRGEYLIGVTYIKFNNKGYPLKKPFLAKCKNPFKAENQSSYIGYYETEYEAFLAYKERKEFYAKRLARYYKGTVDERIIMALENFCVEECD